jgi:hypothetical protein
MAGQWPPRLFHGRAGVLDATTREMIDSLAHHRTMLEDDRETVAELITERDRLKARVALLQDALVAAGIPIPPDDYGSDRLSASLRHAAGGLIDPDVR